MRVLTIEFDNLKEAIVAAE